MSAPTPGPWRAATQIRSGMVGFVVFAETLEGTAVVSEAFPQSHLVAVNAANAALIAAAPDLLDACESLTAAVALDLHPESVRESIVKCRAAIAKARGGK